MYCRKCGREIPDDSVMCGYCGTPVNPDNPYTYGGTPQNMDEGANGLGIASMILGIVARSEERRVGKECRSRWSPYH